MPSPIRREQNNNTIPPNGIHDDDDVNIPIYLNGQNGDKKVIPTKQKDDVRININGINGIHMHHDDTYRPFTIFDSENEKYTVHPSSTTGSLSSITTTSVASSEPDPGSDKGGDDRLTVRGELIEEEWWKTTLQVSIPFFIAGIGTIGAGVILGRVEHWDVFKAIHELFILIPALIGLKGNLDMCLASRLSTQANLGNMKTRSDIIKMVFGNIALVQVQATVAAFLVACFAITIGAIIDHSFDLQHSFLLIAASMFTATSSCFVLDFVLVAVILLSHKFRLNPDNLATPLAASIGDVVSLSILSFIASLLYENLATHSWILYLIIGIYFTLLPMWVCCVYFNSYTKPVLKSGWIPVLSALLISGLGGLVLDEAVKRFNGFTVFQPIINGIGGNLVSVQSSKMSTMLHQSSIIGIVPPFTKVWELPWRALFRGVPYAKTARILILLSIPGQIVFICVADFLYKHESTIGATFIFSYLSVSILQVCLLLYIAHVIIHLMWRLKIDPDNSAIPYLTALGDFFGSMLLALAFLFMQSIGHVYDAGEPADDTLITTTLGSL